MNILILSSGSRVKLVEYFLDGFHKNGGKVFTADCSPQAPTLYISDGYFLLPEINDVTYINEVINICNINNIDAVISLIDPELSILSKNKELFKKNNIFLVVSENEQIELCFDKFSMSEFLTQNNINTPKTYNNFNLLKKDLEKKILDFPLFMKPKCGSASLNMLKIDNARELIEFENSRPSDFIVQEFIDGKEYGVDVYVDFISGKPIEIFIKEKLKMRAGETDKSVSIDSEKIKNFVINTLQEFNLKGPLDIDIFENNGELKISEINPRFGGGYLHAHESGCDFVKLLENNLSGITNVSNEKIYRKTTMMKYSEVLVLEGDVR